MELWEILSIHMAVDAVEKKADSWRQTENNKTTCTIDGVNTY